MARALHSKDEATAVAWAQALKEKLQASAAAEVIHGLNEMLPRLRETRLDSRGDQDQDEPLGSGAMEPPCKQYLTRFQRSAQCWTTAGDEAPMCQETLRRNGRWSLLFPHEPADFDSSEN